MCGGSNTKTRTSARAAWEKRLQVDRSGENNIMKSFLINYPPAGSSFARFINHAPRSFITPLAHILCACLLYSCVWYKFLQAPGGRLPYLIS